jgi:hypothetical protein
VLSSSTKGDLNKKLKELEVSERQGGREGEPTCM